MSRYTNWMARDVGGHYGSSPGDDRILPPDPRAVDCDCPPGTQAFIVFGTTAPTCLCVSLPGSKVPTQLPGQPPTREEARGRRRRLRAQQRQVRKMQARRAKTGRYSGDDEIVQEGGTTPCVRRQCLDYQRWSERDCTCYTDPSKIGPMPGGPMTPGASAMPEPQQRRRMRAQQRRQQRQLRKMRARHFKAQRARFGHEAPTSHATPASLAIAGALGFFFSRRF
jgi:hypothetical protein